MEDRDRQSPQVEVGTDQAPQIRNFDPSEAVTGVAIVFGILGAVVGVISTWFLGGASGSANWIAYFLIAALAGGSAGIVIGGMFGAIFGVIRGVTITAGSDRQ
jgi:hypothetical protein